MKIKKTEPITGLCMGIQPSRQREFPAMTGTHHFGNGHEIEIVIGYYNDAIIVGMDGPVDVHLDRMFKTTPDGYRDALICFLKLSHENFDDPPFEPKGNGHYEQAVKWVQRFIKKYRLVHQ